MTMLANTGTVTTEPCSVCGAMVRKAMYATAPGGRPVWVVDRHTGPCGLTCSGAGVPAVDFRLGNFHGPLGGRSKCPCVAAGERVD